MPTPNIIIDLPGNEPDPTPAVVHLRLSCCLDGNGGKAMRIHRSDIDRRDLYRGGWIVMSCGLLYCRYALFSALLVTQIAFATKVENIKQDAKPMQTETKHLLKNQPLFSLRIEAQHVRYIVGLNGMHIYRDVSGLQVQTAIPVNHWMRNGENELTIKVWPDKAGTPLHLRAQSAVTLQVRPNGAPAEQNQTISRVSYSNPLAHTTGATSLSTHTDRYDSLHGFRPDKQGDVHVSVTTLDIQKNGSITLKQKVKLPVQFPEWAFFSADDLPDVEKLSDDEFKPYYGSALQIYQRVADAIKQRKVDSIMPMFEERSREMDLAYYNPPGTTLAELAADLKKIATRPQTEMLEVSEDYFSVLRYPNNKLLSLVRNDLSDALVFNLKDIHSSESYGIILRRKNGQWFITR